MIAAISLSAAVIILYGLFFAPPAKNVNQLDNQETNLAVELALSLIKENKMEITKK